MSARLIGRTGATAGQEFPLMDVATIGASAENEIRIAAPGVSRRHARIVKEKEQYFVEDARATNGTFLNGGRITREALQHLDVITLGRNVDLIFIRREGDTRPPTVDAITAARLTIADGAEAGTVAEVPKGELTIGRAPSCNVVLASGLVSKVHARVQRTANQVVLQDLQSINGTFVNGARVDSVVVLKDGDTINFAGVRTVKVSIEGAAANKPAPLPAAIAADLPAFNQEWKTRFVWAPDELAAIEQARAEAMQLAAMRAPVAGAADKRAAAPAAAKPAAPAGAKPEAAAAPPRPAAPPAAAAKPAAAGARPAAEVKPPPKIDKPAAAAAPAAAKPPAPVAPKEGVPPAAPRIDKPDVAAAPAAPKPAPPVAPKAQGAQPPPNPAGPLAPAPSAAAKAAPGVPPAPAPVDKVAVPPAGVSPAAGEKIQAASVTPAGPAQAAIQAAEVPIKPGSPVPVKPDPASAARPHAPAPPPVAPKPPDPARAAQDVRVTPPIAPADVGVGDVTVPMARAPRLRGLRLVGAGAPIALGLGTFVVGRAAGSDVRLDDRQVSRSHARITIDESSAFIEDMQTVNGTLVNGKEVKTRQPLHAGDTVQLGASAFTVELTTT